MFYSLFIHELFNKTSIANYIRFAFIIIIAMLNTRYNMVYSVVYAGLIIESILREIRYWREGVY
jgi:hypothetical protein